MQQKTVVALLTALGVIAMLALLCGITLGVYGDDPVEPFGPGERRIFYRPEGGWVSPVNQPPEERR